MDDAVTMGRLIRSKGFSTEVEAGKMCASACPLAFAGGVDRRAFTKSSIGVHRAIVTSSAPTSRREAVEDGQKVSAESQRYLREMGVDAAVWLHAMETPHEDIYTFTAKELIDLKLATSMDLKN